MYMNSREDAAIAVKGMESRVHQDNEELRKKGVKQYLHTVKKKHNQKILDKEAAVSTEVDLSKEQYEQVNEHMSDERNPGHTEPGKTGIPLVPRRAVGGENLARIRMTPELPLTRSRRLKRRLRKAPSRSSRRASRPRRPCTTNSRAS